jgi:hypothetical protein
MELFTNVIGRRPKHFKILLGISFFQSDTSFLAFGFFGNLEARQNDNADK